MKIVNLSLDADINAGQVRNAISAAATYGNVNDPQQSCM